MDVQTALSYFSPDLTLPLPSDLDEPHIDSLIKSLSRTVKTSLASNLDTWSRLSLLRGRLEPREEGQPTHTALCLRHYLTQVHNHSHRRWLTKLLCGDLVPLLFRASPSTLRTLSPNEIIARSCRACHTSPETPQHVFLQCLSLPHLCVLRTNFLISLPIALPMSLSFSDDDALSYLKRFIFDWALVPLTARFIYKSTTYWRDFTILGRPPDPILNDSDSEESSDDESLYI
ncbi:hypothetical protein EV361DRAFT_154348 [Lentinula raphanica]|nr:hypothetical protein EV361DRAFT_154348 [Lentinula raphanica]